MNINKINFDSIVIDATILSTLHMQRGIGTYARELLLRFPDIIEGSKPQCIAIDPQQINSIRVGYDTTQYFRPKRLRCRGVRIWNEWFLPRAIRRAKAQCFFSLDPDTLVCGKGYEVIGTIYDLIPKMFPEPCLKSAPYDQQWAYEKYLKSVTQAKHLIAISETTKKDFVKMLDIDPRKISVAPLAYNQGIFNQDLASNNSPWRNKELANKYNLRHPYILYVGAVDYRKNFQMLARAFSMIRARGLSTVELVMVGPMNDADRILVESIVLSERIADFVRHLGHVPISDLVGIYGGALCMGFPSRYEGFGLPVLEATACGCPVVACKGSAIDEVVYDPSELCDPDNPEEFASMLERIMSDADYRKGYLERNLKKAKVFTWEECAKKTKMAISECLTSI